MGCVFSILPNAEFGRKGKTHPTLKKSWKMRNFQKRRKFPIFARNCMSFSKLWIFFKIKFFEKNSESKIFYDEKKLTFFVLSRVSKTMYTSATVVKGGHRNSMIAFWVNQSTKKFQNSKLWENLLENLGVREDRPDHDQPWIFP